MQTKQLKLLFIMFPNARNEYLLVTDFKQCKRYNDWKKHLIVAARAVFLQAMHEIEQSISGILIITINSILLYDFPRKSCAPLNQLVAPPKGHTLHFLNLQVVPLMGHFFWEEDKPGES